MKDLQDDSFLIHGLFEPQSHGGVINPPVYHASTIAFASLDDMEARQREVAREDSQTMWYGRKGTPTSHALQDAIATLEGGYRSLVMPSGLSACVTAIMAFVRAGDHILVSDSVYGPTRHFVSSVLSRYGVTASFYDPTIGAGIEALIQPNTRLVYAESPGSYSFEIQDIPAIAQAAHARGALVVLDNTWATPLYFKPFDHGVDVSVHAATKYIVGHSDAMLGMVTTTREHWKTLRDYVFAVGQTAGPDDMYLALRGLRTLSVRLQRHWESGLHIAQWLAARPEVERVLHPALPNDPGHALWKRDYKGASGLFGVVLKPCDTRAFRRFIDGLQLFQLGFSWGGFESLVMPFDPGHEPRLKTWPHPGPVFRLHIGLEAVEDLKADLEQALRRLG